MLRHKLNILFFVFSTILILVVFWKDEKLLTYLLGSFLIFFLVLSAGVVFLRFNYFVNSTCRLDKPYVLLTFDDGPDPVLTPIILDVLAQHQVKAVFFVIGKKAKEHPNLISRIQSEGHIIGNHTFSHPPLFALMNGAKVKSQISDFDDVLQNHAVTCNYFRPPVGYTNPIIARVVKEINLKVIGWNKRSYDTVIFNQKCLSKRLLRQAKHGNIILLHDNLKQTAMALPLFLENATKKGIIFANDSDVKTLADEIN